MPDPDVFAAVANTTRRDLMRLLLERGPQPVQDLADHFSMRRPSVSEHLKVLKDAGLVTEERSGRQRLYSLDAGPLRDLADWLAPYEHFWRERLTALRDLLDAEDAERAANPEAPGGDDEPAHRPAGTGKSGQQ